MELGTGDVLFRATMTGAMSYVSNDREQMDTATMSVDVTFKAFRGDIAQLEVQGGTMSISDTTVGYCQGSGTFAGDIPPRGTEDRINPTTGEGIGSLVLNDQNDGISRNPGDPREAISVLILLTLSFEMSCPERSSNWGMTASSCVGDRSTSTSFVLRKTGPGTFAGTCHDDFQGENYSGTFDWSGQAQQISP